jgi:ADP-ribose pyrophosphatase
VVGRTQTRLSPWVEIIEREIVFSAGSQSQIYHGLGLPDYVTILTVTADGRFPLVHQYRPSIERFTCELPSGLVDPGEQPIETARRELREETGYIARSVHELGVTWVDTGRLNNRLHAFFTIVEEHDPSFVPEPGLAVSMATAAELAELVKSGGLAMQIHVGVILQAVLRGYLTRGLTLP